eukprot:gene1791-3476_t
MSNRRHSRPKSPCEIFQLMVFLVVCVILLLISYQMNDGINGNEGKGVLLQLSGFTRIKQNLVTNRMITNEEGTKKNPISKIENPVQQSQFAYVTLMSGIDEKYKYRGFLYNALIMKRALTQSGSTADFIVLVGYTIDSNREPFEGDLNLLRSHGIITYILPRLLHTSAPLGFAEMALLKITPWNFTQYHRIQFFDGDIMPTKNMDCFFKLNFNAFTAGLVSPLNSGWYLALPNAIAYKRMEEKALWRLTRDWDPDMGWGDKMPKGMKYRGGKPVKRWEFNGADMDQGLLTHYFLINHGGALLIDTDLQSVARYDRGVKHEREKDIPLKVAVSCCKGMLPTSFFAHFTGRNKPWMVGAAVLHSRKPNSPHAKWASHLDALNLPVNSTNISSMGLGSPLGFFNANFPKGGFKHPKHYDASPKVV